MLAFILRRPIQAVIAMVVALTAFMLFQYVGEPVQLMLGQDATPARRMQLRIDLGLNRSFIVQFWHVVVFVIINLGVDLLYFAVDPRLRVGNAGGH
jgi:peptide/nickel transport system permease protein